MEVMTEKSAEKFLALNGFEVIKTEFVSREEDLKNVLKGFHYPVVLKVSGNSIVHKSVIGGVKKNIHNHEMALKAFKILKKISGAEGVLIQEQIKEEEYLVGLKKTPEFGYVLVFGKGGPSVEKEGKVNFRVCGVDGMNDLSNDKRVREIFRKLCNLTEIYPRIQELDINPLILRNGKAQIVDARVVLA